MDVNNNNEMKAPEQEEKKSVMQVVWEYAKLIITVVVAALFINNVILINATIPSASMENTIMTGDRIFGLRLSYGMNLELFGHRLFSKQVREPERFDIIIFHYPDDESQLYIKRLIGLPGETVEIRSGKVYINGTETPLDDSFVRETPLGDFGPFVVPEGEYFMLGDNRNNSKDSRFWNYNYVKFEQIVGKALFRYFPSIKILK